MELLDAGAKTKLMKLKNSSKNPDIIQVVSLALNNLDVPGDFFVFLSSKQPSSE